MSFISEKYKAVFIHVPKTGGRSINVILKQYCNPEHDFHMKVLDQNVNRHGLMYALEAKKLVSDEIWNSCFKFGFVRNPWDRVVSMYEHLRQSYINYTILTGQPFEDKVEYMQQMLGILDIGVEDFSFETFVKKVLRDKVFVNYHWDIQLNSVSDQSGNIMLDFLGRFESLYRDFRNVCNRLDLPEIELPHFNKTDRRPYAEYYNYELKKIVSELYIADIETFQYSF